MNTRRWALVAVLATVLALLMVGPAFAGGHAGDPPGLARAIAAQEAHTDALMAKEGVVGTAVGLGPNGSPVVLILTERAGVAGLPRSLDGVKVVPMVTGKLYALHHRPNHCDGPPGADLPPSCDTGGGNTAPTADNQSVSTEVDSGVGITLSGSDKEDCELVFNIASVPSNGGLSVVTDQACSSGDPNTDTAQVTYTPSSGFEGTDSFTFTVTDGGDPALSDTATVSIAVGATITFPRPANIGTSSGAERLITIDENLFCTVGTLGVRLTDGTNVFALSNAHVYALEGSDPAGPVTDRILQPGRVDLTEQACGSPEEIDAAVIGNLAAFKPLIFDNGTTCSTGSGPGQGINDPDCNTIDAAIALTTTALVGNATPSDGYGTPKSTTVGASINQKVQKYGRTTGLTKGKVSGINATVTICYDSGCAKFVGQIIVQPGNMLQGGDSGSLLVAKGGPDNRKPVGLLFAGSVITAIANPIDLVLDEFGVIIDGE